VITCVMSWILKSSLLNQLQSSIRGAPLSEDFGNQISPPILNCSKMFQPYEWLVTIHLQVLFSSTARQDVCSQEGQTNQRKERKHLGRQSEYPTRDLGRSIDRYLPSCFNSQAIRSMMPPSVGLSPTYASQSVDRDRLNILERKLE
jgi:hypothetical protein